MSESHLHKWRFKFPNAADFNFNYWTLLNDDDQTPIAEAPPNKQPRIAIVGAGVAGLTAARELFRSGYTNIDIYEATKRIGGRTYSLPSALPDGVTTYELGAMRLPFFWPKDSESTAEGCGYGPGSQNCVVDYYCTRFGITTQMFPNPGEVKTGIYINRGRGPMPQFLPDVKQLPPPKLIDWVKLGGAPGEPTLDRIYNKWVNFKKAFLQECSAAYGRDAAWAVLWQKKIRQYGDLSFRDFVRRSVESGGLGMNADESRVFAVIGLGDAGWGAFYDISVLWVLRTLFGFSDKLQLIRGVVSADGIPSTWEDDAPSDSLGQHLDPPTFLGVQSLAECLFYRRDESEKSLYEAIKEAKRERAKQIGVHLYIDNPVRSLTFLEEARGLPPHRENPDGPPVRLVSDRITRDYDAVIITAPPWSLIVETPFENFSPDSLPWPVREAMNSSHFIPSCKVFYPLKNRYWDRSSPIPQVIITDTFAQGAYGVAVADKEWGYPGVLLASYTWGDDATKLVSDDDQELGRRCLAHLDGILQRCGIEDRLSNWVDDRKAIVHHWLRSPWQRGSVRVYRAGNSTLDSALLTYNRRYSAKSHLYLAGESYSVEGGWVEPALRSALDAAIHVVRNTGGQFRKGFDYSQHYPEHVCIASALSDSRTGLV